MRAFRAVLALLAAVMCGPALAGPDDYVFEFRLVEDGGREIVATCRGRAPCVLDEGLRGEVGFAVQIEVTSEGISIGIAGHGAHFLVRHAHRSDGREVLTRRPGRWVTVSELPASLRVIRYEIRPSTLSSCGLAVCSPDRGSDRRVGSGYLTVRPLPLAREPDDDL